MLRVITRIPKRVARSLSFNREGTKFYQIIGTVAVAIFLAVLPVAVPRVQTAPTDIDLRSLPIVEELSEWADASVDLAPIGVPVVPVPTPEVESPISAETPVPSSHARRAGQWISSPLSGPTGNAPVANFGVVEQGTIYRSAQPTESDYHWLLSQGVRSVVSLRREAGDKRDHVLGLGFRNYLWLDVEDENEPSEEQAEQFLDFVTNSDNWPVVFHCKVGLGRTGTMAALIRYAVDGWSMEEAIEEAKIYRGGINLIQPQVDWLNSWAQNHPPGCHHPAP